MIFQQITPDKQKAKSLLLRAREFSHAVELLKNSGEASVLITMEYDILHALSGAILACDGEKIMDKDHHQSLIFYITKEYMSEITLAQKNIFDELRKTRNDINYYGQKDKGVLIDFYERNKEQILKLRQILQTILQKKIEG